MRPSRRDLKLLLQDVRRWRFWRHLGVHSFAALGLQALVLGLADALFPDIFKGIGSKFAITVLVISALYGLVRAWPRPIEQTYTSPNTKIRLVEGDLFDQTDHLVVGMSTTFDTKVPYIVARESVQGQFLDREFDGDLIALDRALDEALSAVAPVGSIEKPGKTSKYPMGTVATLKHHARCYFCLAYTEMNERNEARGSVDGVWRSLDSLWRAISAHGNGSPVSMPVIGGGQARLSQILPAQDSIRFIILSYVLASRREKICDELSIIVRPSDYESLDRLEIQAFLRSLKKS